jgi:hypothetical protein
MPGNENKKEKIATEGTTQQKWPQGTNNYNRANVRTSEQFNGDYTP